MNRKTARCLLIPLIASLLLSACSGGGDGGTSGTTDTPVPTQGATAAPTAPQTTPTEIPPEGEPPMEDIVTYQNPLLTATDYMSWPDYGFGDPFVMRYNGVYYLYCSTKDGNQGIRCWSSENLVDWQYEGVAAADPKVTGAYAPEVYYYNGYFYMYTSPAGNGHYVLRSTEPTRGFRVVTDNMGMSIDGSVFMDNDGKWYFYTAGQGAMRVYDMTSPTTMVGGRSLSTVTVNGGWTEGGMVVYHDGYYYITYTGNHVLSTSYRILYGSSKTSPVAFEDGAGRPPLLVNTSEEVYGIGHSSTVKGPDLDSYYIVYHSLVDTLPNRNMNIDRISFNGGDMRVLGPTTRAVQVPDMPDVYHSFAPGSALTGWRLEGNLLAGNGMTMAADSRLVSQKTLDGDFTAEYNIRSITEGARAGALFGYTDGDNYGSCVFDPAGQQVIITVTVGGESSVTKVPTVRSFGEDTRFDCLQSLQIERCGEDYTFYMNDKLLTTVEACPLAGGAIGYVTEGGAASFGFIGGTAGVGGRASADDYKSVSELDGYIPALEYVGETLPHERKAGITGVVSASDTPVSYRILATSTGTYDLSAFCLGGGTAEVLVDGVSLGTMTLPGGKTPMTAILRGIDLTKGQHTLTVKPSEEVIFFHFDMRKAKSVSPVTINPGDPDTAIAFSDGAWNPDGTSLSCPTGFTGRRLYGYKNWGDYTATLTLTPGNGSNCGLLVRATDPGNPVFQHDVPTEEENLTGTDWLLGYYVGLEGDSVFIGKQSYGYTELVRAAGDFPDDETHTLRVECYGATLRVFVNGALYLEYTDPEPYLQGMVGVRCYRCAATFHELALQP